jgi:uncharacterized protein (TIGR00255 family)
MLKSMTGYGKGAAAGDTFKVTVDVRSVNNRNLDIHWRAPQELAALEIPLKKQVQAAVARGRVDVTIYFSQTSDVVYEINRPLVRGYLEALKAMREEFSLAGAERVAGVEHERPARRRSGAGDRERADAGADGDGGDARRRGA